jgi:DNA-binding transcriptional LysR family regulator
MKEPLDSRQLRAFVSLAQTGSFTRTGQELFVSQSAISHAIRVLENDVGCQLLHRLGKSVQLTPAGEQFLYHAEKILRDMAGARESLAQLGRWAKGHLRLAAAGSICQYLLPAALGEFRREYPDWLVSLELADTRLALQRLQERRIDLAFVLAPARSEPVETIPVFQDELLFAMSPEHHWARDGRVCREELPRQQLILYSRASSTFELIDRYFRREGIVLRLSMELPSIQTIKELVQRNLGVSILAPWVAQAELAGGRLVTLPLGKRRLRREWVACRLPDAKATLAEATLVRFAQEAAAPASGRAEAVR